MSFWGVEVKPGRPHSHQFHNTQRRRLHISQATLGVGTSAAKSLVQCNVGDKAPVLLCCLIPDKSESCHLALEFEEEDADVIFSVLGPRSVHLTGFYLNKPSTSVNNGDDTDSYGEDIGETESDPCNDYDDDENEYEDDFIDDGDIEFVPDSPRSESRVVIEEILDDDTPAKVNGNRKRLKKKYQVSGSDGDAEKDIAKNDRRIFTVESDDEEGLPLSSAIKAKHQLSDSAGNDQKQNIDKGGTGSFDLDNENEEFTPLSSVLNAQDVSIQEKSDKKEFVGNKKNETQDVGDQVTGIERKIEDIEGCEIERRIEQTTSAPLLSLEVGHEIDELPKKKKRKRTKDGQTGGIRDESMVDVREKDQAELVEAKIEDISQATEAINNLSNNMGAVCVRHDREEKPKKKKKKRAIESQYGGVEARIDGTSKNELVKDQPIDKAVEQSSHVNDVKTKKKERKQAKERQSTEVGDDSKIDVQEENIQVKEAVNDDFNQEVLLKDNAIDNISNDKGVGRVGHDSEKPKKKKKRGKESRNVGVENDNKIFVQEEENCKVEAKIDDISKNEPIKDQPNDNLSFDNTKKHGKEKQTGEVADDSMIDIHQKKKIQVEEAGIADINQEDAVKDKAHENVSNDKGDVQGQENDMKVKKKNKQAKERQTSEAGDQSMINVQIERIIAVEEARIKEITLGEPFNNEAYDNISNDKGVVMSEVGNEIQEKPTKKKKKRVKEEPTSGINDSTCDVLKRAKSLIVKENTDDITHVEPLKDEGVSNLADEKCFEQKNDSSLLPLKIGHDNKEKPKKKKKKRAIKGQTGGAGEDSLIVVHKEVQSEIFEAKTDDVTMEDRFTEEFDKQSNGL